jgi:hypothetical protein
MTTAAWFDAADAERTISPQKRQAPTGFCGGKVSASRRRRGVPIVSDPLRQPSSGAIS